jgi:NADP-dependent 3-hydroxy acid dehydrogenase YdfG
MEFEGKVAVITGGASGIGRAVALALARIGTDIVVADIDDVRLEEVRYEIESIGRRVLALHCDISKDADVNYLEAQTILTMGKADILMNNAGVMLHGFVDKMSITEWEWIMNINVLGVVRGVHAFLPHMLKRGSGYIINTSSIAGLNAIGANGAPVTIAYVTSKFAVTGFSESLHSYLHPKGIMVSLLCPGPVFTNLRFSARYVGDNQQEIKSMKSDTEKVFKSPNVLDPDDVAQIVIKAMQEKRFLILTHPEEVH